LAEHLICNQRVSGSNPLIGIDVVWLRTWLAQVTGMSAVPVSYIIFYAFPTGNYGIGVPMNVRCEGTIVLYHRNSIHGNTVGVFHGDVRQCGEPLVCGTSVSRFESDTSQKRQTACSA
jgi:hypothetical protein